MKKGFVKIYNRMLNLLKVKYKNDAQYKTIEARLPSSVQGIKALGQGNE